MKNYRDFVLIVILVTLVIIVGDSYISDRRLMQAIVKTPTVLSTETSYALPMRNGTPIPTELITNGDWVNLSKQLGSWKNEIWFGNDVELVFAQFYPDSTHDWAYTVTYDMNPLEGYLIYWDGTVEPNVNHKKPLTAMEISELEALANVLLPIYPDLHKYWLKNR